MNTITVVNSRSGAAGEYIGRPSPLGNPFAIGRDGTRDEVIAKYRKWILKRIPENGPVTKEINRLWTLSRQGPLVLVCWCAPKRCHGDVVKEILKGEY